MPIPVKVGLIGGSGLDNPDLLKNRVEKAVTTVYGDPSDVLIEGEIEGVPCVLLARHGRKHDIMPSNINYRANIWALKEAGCTHVLVSSACGSLKEEIKPGDLVIPNNFIDRTGNRENTFHDGKEGSLQGVLYLPMEPPFCTPLRELIIDVAGEAEVEVHKEGTVIVIEGPRYSTKTESNLFISWQADLINMTLAPECILAKEAGLLYVPIVMATNYDCWKEGDTVTHDKEDSVYDDNVDKVIKLISVAVPKIGARNWDKELNELKKLTGADKKACGCSRK